jgi:SNF2 family DNA or RNA helicase
MFNTINVVKPGLISFWAYVHQYCAAKNTRWGWDFSGASNTEELHRLLSDTIMIRRLKKDVLKDLPPKIKTVLPLEMEDKVAREYRYAESNLIEWLQSKEGKKAAERAQMSETLVRIEKLKQLAFQAKKKSVLAWIDEFYETGEKLVVFCTHKTTVEELKTRYKEVCVVLDGSTSMKDRQKAVDDFQNNPEVKIFIGNLNAAGVGITLTASSNVAFVELGWSPGLHSQASDRCHRIGSKGDSINTYYLIAEDTIEEEIAALLDKKMKVLDQVLDGKETEDESLLCELLDRLKGKE